MELAKARVRWFLSLDQDDLPKGALEANKRTYRSLSIDGKEVEFSDGFANLHTAVYKETLSSRGFGLDDVRASIQVVHDIRHSIPIGLKGEFHPLAKISLKG